MLSANDPSCVKCGASLVPNSHCCSNCGDELPRGLPVQVIGALVPRYLAATIDTIPAIVLGIGTAKLIHQDVPPVQVPLMVAAYLGYFLGFEGIFSRTPGKFIMSLSVVGLDGSRLTWRQALIRTLFRIVELNPLVFGALPAMICICLSQNRQRFGDKCAGTIVVSTRPGRTLSRRSSTPPSALTPHPPNPGPTT